MAEAPQSESGGGGIGLDGLFIFLVIIVLLVLWLRAGGWHDLSNHKIDFGWRPALKDSGLPFSPNFQNLAPKVSIPTASKGPDEPSGPAY